MKEITTPLQAARIRYRWGFPFKLVVPRNGSAYAATSVLKGQEILVKLGLLEPEAIPNKAHSTNQTRKTDDLV